MDNTKNDTSGQHEADVDNSAISEEQQNKLLKLLGGKKAANANAAAEWMHKSRSVEEEKSLKTGLEAQYNASLNLRLSGKSRRHEGIGFEQEKDTTQNQPQLANDLHGKSMSKPSRERSRSPLRKSDKDSDNNTTSKTTEDKTSQQAKSQIKPISKKNFYMQFAKSSDS